MRRVGIFRSLFLFLIVIYIRQLAVVQNKEWRMAGEVMNYQLKGRRKNSRGFFESAVSSFAWKA